MTLRELKRHPVVEIVRLARLKAKSTQRAHTFKASDRSDRARDTAVGLDRADSGRRNYCSSPDMGARLPLKASGSSKFRLSLSPA